jgi:ferredoxin/flavodoxin---NADP+ reductase
MVALATEKVLDVRHWNESLFSFRTTRDAGLRFQNGHFVMIGLPPAADGTKTPMRAYSIASANYEEHLEFFSIKVANGPLTSRLQNLKPGDDIIVSRKPTGTLLLHDLLPGKRLYLLSTGTGLAPFLSIIRDPETYERFEKVVLVHGVRQVSDLAYHDYLAHELPDHELLGESVRKQLIYYPTATREPFRYNGRLTELVQSGKLFRDIGLPSFTPDDDRAMICGSPAMLADTRELLDARGFQVSPHIGTPGHYVFERAFVEK